MKIQVSTDYATQILQYLHRNRGEVHTATSIVAFMNISYPLFTKIANQLKKGNFLSSVQGRNGGYQLAKPAEEISFYDVFLCMEGDLSLRHCLKKGGKPCRNGELHTCKMQGFFRSVQEKIIADMSNLYIADLAS